MLTHSQRTDRRYLYRFAGLFLLAGLVLSACQSAEIPVTGETPPAAQAATATSAPAATDAATDVPASAEAEISIVNDPQLGEILVGNNGMTLYMFTVDDPNQSNCDSDCLALWPPLRTQGEPVLGEGVDPDLVGSAELADGTMIVTYNEMPLYYWVNDAQAGDTTGQGVGDVWFVVSPSGELVGAPVEEGAEADEGTPAAAASGEAEINVVEDAKFGEILVGNNGMTLYIFTKDAPNQSNCTGDCLANWPPLLTKGEPVLGEGVDPKLVGMAELADGSRIVTYNEMPLYFWVNDTQAGDTTGQGVGEVWFVIGPDGNSIMEEIAQVEESDTGYN